MWFWRISPDSCFWCNNYLWYTDSQPPSTQHSEIMIFGVKQDWQDSLINTLFIRYLWTTHFPSLSPSFILSEIETELPWWLSGKEAACQCRRRRFNPWVRTIPWRRKWQLTVFLSGKSQVQRSLAGYRPRGGRRVGHNWATKQHQQRRGHAWMVASPRELPTVASCPRIRTGASG